MAAAETTVALNPEELNPTDRAILDELQDGRSTPAYIADAHGYTAGNVRNRMTSLAKHGHVDGLGGGLYKLTDDPRDESASYVGDGESITDALEAQMDENDELSERVIELEAELDDCQERLADARERATGDTAALRRALDDVEAAAERGDGQALQDALGRARAEVGDGE